MTVRIDESLEGIDWPQAKADLAADDFDNDRSPGALQASFEQSQHDRPVRPYLNHRASVTWRGASLSAVSQGGEISVSRVFDAPRELVYRAFVDPDQLCQWFGPTGFSVPCETVHSDARTGGFQRFMLVSDADPTRRTPVDVALNEVVEDELLVAHADIGATAGAGRTARIRLRLEFLDQASGTTRLELRQDPSRHEICDDPEAAWESSFTRLDSLLRRTL